MPLAPEATLPVDTSVVIPPALAKQVADANALHERHYPKIIPAEATPAAPVAAVPAAPAPAAPAAVPAVVELPAPSTPEQRAGVDPQSADGRYYAMEGRYRQSQATVGQLQQQMAELGDELMRCQQTITQLRQGTQPPQQRAQPVRGQGLSVVQKFVTAEDVQTYGPELIDVVQRAAREALQPDLAQVAQQTQQTNQRVMQSAQAQMYLDLDRAAPTWREINVNPRFKAWCRLPDVYSGVVRGQLMKDAFQAANAPRVASFFQGFLAEEQATGQVPAPGAEPQAQAAQAPRIAAVPLENLTAPGRAKPAGGDQPRSAADKPVYSRAQVAAFYANVRAGRYIGRETEKAADEALIFAAQADGRIR